MGKNNIKIVYILIILTYVSTLGCVQPEYTEIDENFKSISDMKPSEFRSQYSDLLLIHHPEVKKDILLRKNVYINIEAKNEGNSSISDFLVNVQFYKKDNSLICNKTLDRSINLKPGENQSIDLDVTKNDCSYWDTALIKKYKLEIIYLE